MAIQLLSIETSTDACSVALLLGETLIERFEVAPQQHTQKILPFCEALLAEAECTLSQLDAIAVGQGPGSFTGVRLAISIAQGLAYTANRPIAPISSLQALAQSAIRLVNANAVLTAVDARMQAVYWGAFRAVDGRAEPVITECEGAPDQVPIPEGTDAWIGIGNGWTYPALQTKGVDLLPGCFPRARDVAWLAQRHVENQTCISPADVQAIYLRNPYPPQR